MPIKSKNNGLKKLSSNLEELGKKKSLSLSELMPTDFISKYSQYENVDKLFEQSGFNLKAQSDFSAIPENEMDKFISKNTSFISWLEMQKKAIEVFTQKQILKGL